jgi:hypothetical protein
MVIVGVPGAAMVAGWTTLEQTLAADSHRGRVIAAIGAVASLGSLVGASAAAVIGQAVPVVPLLIVQGSGYVIGGIVVAWMTRRSAAPPSSDASPAGQSTIDPSN